MHTYRSASIATIKLAATGLMLTMAIGCSTGSAEPDVDTSAVEPEEVGSLESEAAASAPAPAENSPANNAPAAQSTSTATQTAQVTEPQGEPGYIGYPSMGKTANGDDIYYVSSQPLDCGPDMACLTLQFVQVDGADPNQAMNGTAVANCTRQTLAEVILDGDLVAYEITSPDAGMAQLINTACQAWRPGEPGAGVPIVPEGLTAGMSYGEVRSRLKAEGWMPKEIQMAHYTPLEQKMYDQGYTEVLGCSGTGLCRFEFDYYLDNIEDGEALVVITEFSPSDPFFEEDPILGSVNIAGSTADAVSIN